MFKEYVMIANMLDRTPQFIRCGDKIGYAEIRYWDRRYNMQIHVVLQHLNGTEIEIASSAGPKRVSITMNQHRHIQDFNYRVNHPGGRSSQCFANLEVAYMYALDVLAEANDSELP